MHGAVADVLRQALDAVLDAVLDAEAGVAAAAEGRLVVGGEEAEPDPREEGVASAEDEMTVGACSLAVPVRAGERDDAEVVAALGVVVPSLRRERARLVAALQVAAAGIGRRLVRWTPPR